MKQDLTLCAKDAEQWRNNMDVLEVLANTLNKYPDFEGNSREWTEKMEDLYPEVCAQRSATSISAEVQTSLRILSRIGIVGFQTYFIGKSKRYTFRRHQEVVLVNHG